MAGSVSFDHASQVVALKSSMGMCVSRQRRPKLVHGERRWRLAEAGCTDPEIAAITGHSLERTRQILETYLPRTPEMARNAMAKWESKSGTESNRCV
jgi:hypothetical protein